MRDIESRRHEATTVECIDGVANSRNRDDSFRIILNQERHVVVFQSVSSEITHQANCRDPHRASRISANPQVASLVLADRVDRVLHKTLDLAHVRDRRAIDMAQARDVPTRTCPSDPTISARTRVSINPSASFMAQASSPADGSRSRR